jgi:twitching motility protein PilT
MRKISQMGKYVPDPEIDRLVQETNLLADGGGEVSGSEREPRPGDLDDARLRVVDSGERLGGLLRAMADLGASDLVLVAGSPPVARVDGRLRRLDHEALGEHEVEDLFSQHLGSRSRRILGETGAADFSLSTGDDGVGGIRLRVNIQRQGGRLTAAVRALPQRIPTLEELNLPPQLSELVVAGSGLVLVCGPTGSGKSTTLAALLDRLNRMSFRHVITIEDPVEYRHVNRQSVFEQIEVGSDSPSFSAALRSALRRDPDVILVGEMRDLETMSAAITAAETGHLILSTLHTGDAAQAVHRIIDVFPAEQQRQVSHQLALSLSAIVCQQLLPSARGDGRLPAVEVLLATYAVRNHIRRGNLDRLYNELMGGQGRGMVSMEQALADLVRAGRVSAEEARMRSSRPDELERMLGGG